MFFLLIDTKQLVTLVKGSCLWDRPRLLYLILLAQDKQIIEATMRGIVYGAEKFHKQNGRINISTS